MQVPPHRQKGLALLVLVFIFALAAIGYVVYTLDATGMKSERDKKTVAALAEAKVALLGSVVRSVVEPVAIGESVGVTVPVYLPNPDLASPPSKGEGEESLAFGAEDFSVVGKLPWKSLEIAPLKDGWGECIWYAVSGRFKKSPSTSVLNWDTQGQIDVINESGIVIAKNLAALVLAPTSPIQGQNRSLVDAKYSQCGGNYDPKNYLDTYSIANAVAGEVNFFSGSADNRKAADNSSKKFVLASNESYNDKFAYITVDEIFDPLAKRSDFIDALNKQLDNAAIDIAVHAVGAAGAKGTDNINCISGLNTNQTFCENWKEMFLLKENSKVNGVDCNKVFIFSGKKTGIQERDSISKKSDPKNYLEGSNLSAFLDNDLPRTSFFSGGSEFDGNNPSADVMKCI